ncbi:hypothetical protein BZG35_11435 [Brevundimonas sp. LM2]|uniref:hypothetical protein n=1 Tax=Brevundimonas sp. LM2 TaxID=1938605 RepID=UPI000983E360|nr:hypothetical protein [Brevundimonas sp. LM2]AQR62187.1 hypothetical protein BZG35_11435 [Brevundimonas sp. LM2]
MIRSLTAVAATALLLAACGEPEPAAAPAIETPAIVPPAPAAATAPAANVLTAQGYGPLRIGMTRAEVVTALGDDASPNTAGGAEPEVCDVWRPEQAPEGVLVMIQDGVLTRISVARTTAWKTDRGFGVGDTAAAIKAAYGPLVVAQPHKYSAPPAEDLFVWQTGGPATAGEYVQDAAARGIRYEIGSDGKVSMVHVGGPAIQLVEGCS